MNALIKGAIWSTCLLALMTWLIPAHYSLTPIDRDFSTPNTIGVLCAFAILLSQFLMRRRGGKWRLLQIIFLATTILFSNSEAALVALLFCEVLLIFCDEWMSRGAKVLTLAGLFLAVGSCWAWLKLYPASHANTLVFKGVPTWKPFEIRHALNELPSWPARHGLAETLLLFAVYVSLFQQIRKVSRGPFRLLLVSMALFAVVNGLQGAESFSVLPLGMIVFTSMVSNSLDSTRSDPFFEEAVTKQEDMATPRVDSLPELQRYSY